MRDAIVFQSPDGEERHFEVVGLADDDEERGYAVCYCEATDEFIVTDAVGELVTDETLAQELLDNFLVLAQEAEDEAEAGPSVN